MFILNCTWILYKFYTCISMCYPSILVTQIAGWMKCPKHAFSCFPSWSSEWLAEWDSRTMHFLYLLILVSWMAVWMRFPGDVYYVSSSWSPECLFALGFPAVRFVYPPILVSWMPSWMQFPSCAFFVSLPLSLPNGCKSEITQPWIFCFPHLC